MSVSTRAWLVLIASFWFAGSSHAQDSHYWQSGYSPGAILSPGSAIAYDHDKGLFYYNPALMAIDGKTSVSISASVYEVDAIKINDAVGSGLDLAKSGYRINPQMISGTVAFKKWRPVTLGYALTKNPVLSFDATQRQDKQMQVLDDSYSPGEETYVGQFSAKNFINTTTGLAGAGIKLNKHWSVGLTVEAQILEQELLEQFSSRALVNTQDTAIYFQPLVNVQSSYQADLWHLGLRVRGGVSYDQGIHHFGLVISSPMVRMLGKATISSDIVISNLQLANTNGGAVNLLANGRQTKIPVTYKMPLSVALGYAIDYGKGQLFLSGEYFAAVDEYNIVRPSGIIFVRPDTGSNRASNTELLKLREKRKAVLNIGLGGSYRVNSNITIMASFRTDYACNDEESNRTSDGTSPNLSTWDVYHLELGGQVRRKKSNLRTGLLCGFGSASNFMQPVNFDDPHEENLMSGTPHTVKASYFHLGLLVSYVYNL